MNNSANLISDTIWSRLIACILILHAAAIIYSASQQSPTYGEIPALPAGIYHWHTGRFDVYRVNPPLVRMIAALPVMLLQPKTDWSLAMDRYGYRSEFDIGNRFLALNGDSTALYFIVARCMCVPFSLLGASVCYAWARDLYGRSAGLSAMLLWCLCPNLLGHGCLLTTDVPAAACGIAACYTFKGWLTDSRWLSATSCGLTLSLALLTKGTWLFLPALMAVWLVYDKVRRQSLSGAIRSVFQYALILTISILLLNVSYGLHRTLRPLGSYEFISEMLTGPRPPNSGVGFFGNRFSSSIVASVPVPLPEDYVLGLDIQRRDFEVAPPTYLMGAWHTTAVSWYYLYAALIKTPDAILCIIAMSVASRCLCRTSWSAASDLPIIMIGGVIAILVCSQSALSGHYRYMFPLLPFVYIFCSECATNGCSVVSKAFSLLLLFLAFDTMTWIPRNIAYSNRVSGGSEMVGYHILGSNVDWGQESHLAREWIRLHAPPRVFVALREGLSPESLGFVSTETTEVIEFWRPLDDKEWTPVEGVYIVSVNRLFSYYDDLKFLRDVREDAKLGYTMRVYRVRKPGK